MAVHTGQSTRAFEAHERRQQEKAGGFKPNRRGGRQPTQHPNESDLEDAMGKFHETRARVDREQRAAEAAQLAQPIQSGPVNRAASGPSPSRNAGYTPSTSVFASLSVPRFPVPTLKEFIMTQATTATNAANTAAATAAAQAAAAPAPVSTLSPEQKSAQDQLNARNIAEKSATEIRNRMSESSDQRTQQLMQQAAPSPADTKAQEESLASGFNSVFTDFFSDKASGAATGMALVEGMNKAVGLALSRSLPNSIYPIVAAQQTMTDEIILLGTGQAMHGAMLHSTIARVEILEKAANMIHSTAVSKDEDSILNKVNDTIQTVGAYAGFALGVGVIVRAVRDLYND